MRTHPRTFAAAAVVASMILGCSLDQPRDADDDDGEAAASGAGSGGAAGGGAGLPAGCEPNPCQNGGICSDDGGGPTCACPQGFTGPSCALPTGIVALSGGYRSSGAIREDGSYWLWGDDGGGPSRLEGLPHIAGVASNDPATLIATDGHPWLLYGWADAAGPAPVPNLSNVVAVASGINHTLALTGDGTVWAWGNNNYGQLGDGTTDASWDAPRLVPGLTGVVAIAAGFEMSFALQEGGKLWAWGNSVNGALCTGTGQEHTPTPTMTASVKAVTAEGGTHVIVGQDGTVWECGYQTGGYEQIHSVPSGIVSVARGDIHTLALRDDGTVWAWGRNDYGQLGDGTTDLRDTPVPVATLSDVVAIAAGDAHSLAATADGTVWAWGHNLAGQLGAASLGDFSTFPQEVPLPAP